MATFVLVHGAMHGGWCWRQVADRLRAQGHAVHAPTLTGLGDRAHLLTPEVGLATHVEDLTRLLWFEDLADVSLVLHSYAGVLAGPVVAGAGGRVATIVHLGAFLAGPGESLLDVEPEATAARYRALAAEAGDGWRIPASPAFLAQWGMTDPDVVAWAAPRLTDFPLRCCTEAARYEEGALAGVRQVYVRHTDPPLPSLDPSYARAVAAGWERHDLACGHDAMLAAPAATAELLDRLVR